MPPTDKYAPTAWGQLYLHDLEVPSGQLCQVRRPGVEGLMRENVLPRIDRLTDLVDKKHVRRVREGKQISDSIDLASLAADQDQLLELLSIADRVVEAIVVQPLILRPVVRGEHGELMLDADGKEIMLQPADRQPGVVYTDYIDANDRMFIFNYAVGGSADLERFRQQSAKLIGSLGTGEDMEPAAE
jgi:hypothetical protein